MSRNKVIAVSWFFLVLLTLFLVTVNKYPRALVALVAWFGGIGTQLMYDRFRGRFDQASPAPDDQRGPSQYP